MTKLSCCLGRDYTVLCGVLTDTEMTEVQEVPHLVDVLAIPISTVDTAEPYLHVLSTFLGHESAGSSNSNNVFA